MCIEEISGSEACSENGAESFFYDDDYSLAEINGRQCEVRVIHETTKFIESIHRKRFLNRSLTSRSIIHKPSASTIMRLTKTGGSVEGSLTFEWGGEEGTSWASGFAAEAYDDKGNYAKIELKQDSDGKGKAEVSAGHKEESK